MPDFTVVIPTLNERGTITGLLKELRSLYPSAKVIVADDGSRDGTQKAVLQVARKDRRISLLDRSESEAHGLTASVLDAAGLAKTDFIVVMDGDLQHPPEKVGDLVGELARGADVAVAYRVGVEGAWPFERRVMSKGAELLGAAALAVRGAPQCRDVLSGFFAARAALLRDAARRHPNRFELEGYKVLFDLLKALPRDAVVAEVPYVFNQRRSGSSKIGLMHIGAFLRSLVR